MAEKKKTLRYSPEFRERAARLLDEHRSDYLSISAACHEVGGNRGCSGDSLHDWWKQARRYFVLGEINVELAHYLYQGLWGVKQVTARFRALTEAPV